MDIIDQIQQVRKKNNEAWMDLLRLAYEAEPEKAKRIIRRIEQNDTEIKGLLHRLGSDC